MNPTTEYTRWLNAPALNDDERAELAAIAGDAEEIASRFGGMLTFGTGGLRGIMKTGPAAMNRHTVAHATQCFANVVKKHKQETNGTDGAASAAVAHDSRINSREFAEIAACVLAANGIRVYLFDSLRPTPELSFAVRELGCDAGINITASHNPREYNGYKAYWNDGAQLGEDLAGEVAANMCETDIFNSVKCADLASETASGMIGLIGGADNTGGDCIDEKYLAAVLAQRVNPDVIPENADKLKIVYTPLHGAGYRLVPELLRRAGVRELAVVPEQAVPDGTFPTAPKPNPEYAQVFEPGIRLAGKTGADLIIATDPDADRMAAMYRGADGKFVTLTGNQAGAIMLDYIIRASDGKLPGSAYAIKTIVSTELVTRICAAGGVKLYNVLTGFKYIGETIRLCDEVLLAKGEGSGFIFGFEESCGYLRGTYSRDKDGVLASLLLCEVAAYYASRGMTLCGALEEMYKTYGFSEDISDEIFMEGSGGPRRARELMASLRDNPPAELGGVRVAVLGDYLAGTLTDTASGNPRPTGLPASDVMYFAMDGGDVVVVRPSGTEPKVKFYYLVGGRNAEETGRKITAYKNSIKSFIG